MNTIQLTFEEFNTQVATLKRVTEDKVLVNNKVVTAYMKTRLSVLSFYYNNTRYQITDYHNIPFNSVTVVNDGETTLKAHDVQDLTKTTKFSNVVKHSKYDQIKTCISCDIPVYLCGEAGTGKNFTLEQIAAEMGLQFYFTNSVQQEYKLTGFIDAGGKYHETEFYKAFTKGGLFFLDEIDASIPEVLVLLNAAIANRYFEFPNGRVTAHPDFRVVAAGNTVGSGADELYTGRLVLDQATLDRFVIIEFDYGHNVELNLAKGDTALVNFIEGLRRFSKENGIRATFSYRCIITTVKLAEAGMDLKTVLTIAVFKGLDKDTIKTFRTDKYKDGNCGKYYYALSDIQMAA